MGECRQGAGRKVVTSEHLPSDLEHLLSVTSNTMAARLVIDSRQVSPGCIFFAMPGTHGDGRRYIKEAANKGASCIVAEAEGFDAGQFSLDGVPVICVTGLRRTLGEFAHRYYGKPSSQMTVIAVTGTNGKTTISQTLAKAMARAGRPSAVVGTLGYGVPGTLVPLENTTPDVMTLHSILRTQADAGMSVVAIEASSHGLDQHRLDAVQIDTAVFSNITRDHLDYHGTLEAYAAAKATLAGWPGLKTLVINADDARVDAMAAAAGSSVRIVRYSLDPASTAEVRVLSSAFSAQGLGFRCALGRDAEVECRTGMMGTFNLSNLLAVVAVLWTQGLAPATIADVLEGMDAVNGRMQRVAVECTTGPAVLVDYAHTPDALEQVLKAARQHCDGELWCVFGCGGNRDKGKRPLMAAIAEQQADHVIVTTDNPRNEVPADIIRDIVGGFSHNHAMIIEDRSDAIGYAIRHAAGHDVVMIAGKGHETYQDCGGVRQHFSDVEQAERALRTRRHGVPA